MRGGRKHFNGRGTTPEQGKNAGNANLHQGRWDQAFHPKGRNKRTVWEIPLSKFRDAHFAVFPEKLVEPCIAAGSHDGDVVLDPFCGAGTTGVVAVTARSAICWYRYQWRVLRDGARAYRAGGFVMPFGEAGSRGSRVV